MPLAPTGAVLGGTLASAAGSVDAPGVAAWGLIGISICAQLPALCVFNPLGGSALASAGGVISGTGALVVAPGSVMGPGLAAAAGSVDAAGIAKWTAIGAAITTWMTAQGQYNVGLVGYVGPPPPGPVTGAGTIKFLAGPGEALAVAAGSTDAAGIAKWTAIGNALKTHLATNLLITPVALVNPGTGGPVTGAALVT